MVQQVEPDIEQENQDMAQEQPRPRLRQPMEVFMIPNLQVVEEEDS